MTRTMVLLGAGASAEASVPTALNMTQDFLTYLDRKGAEEPWYACCAQTLRNVLGAVVGRRAASGMELALCQPNIEELISATRALLHRHVSPLALFADWRPILDTTTLVSTLGRRPNCIGPRSNDTVELLAQILRMPPDNATPDADPLAAIAHYLRATDPQLSDSLRRDANEAAAIASHFERRVVELADPGYWQLGLLTWSLRFAQEYLDSVLWVDSPASLYLSPLFQLARKQESTVIATLNYDTSVESACPDDLTCSTYWANWVSSGEFPTHLPGVTLLKLHGSVDWEGTSGVWTDTVIPEWTMVDRDRPRSASQSWYSDSYIIFGRDEKLQPTGPFLDLLYAFKNALNTASRLVVVGYSFRDEHINEPIKWWLNRSRSHEIYIVDKYFPDEGDPTDPSLRRALPGFERTRLRPVHIVRESASVGLGMLADDGVV